MEKNWSTQQKAIFEFFANGRGNLVVRARAGTGKTTTIIEAVNYAGHESAILLAAFNKRIATELSKRLAAPNVEAKTLHGLGFAFIRRQWTNVKVDAAVDVDRARAACGGKNAPDEIVGLVKKLAALLKNMSPFVMSLDDVADIASMFDCTPDVDWAPQGWDLDAVCDAAVRARDAAKDRDEAGRISFDDMIFIPLANNFARPWFSMVVVDETQDMNYAQLLLVQKACKPRGRIVVVGDDCQAIYGFRGADADGLDRLKRELSATELGLTITYRCGKRIVDVAAKMVPDFVAAEGNADGIVDSIDEEALVGRAQIGDFILSRKNAPLMAICLSLLRSGIRARIEGRDIAAGLKAIIAKFRAKSVPNFIEKVGTWKTKQTARAMVLDAEIAEAKVNQIDDQAATLVALAEGCASINEIYTRCDTLFGDAETSPPAVVCSSVHKAKGLEADHVFVLDATLSTRTREERNIYYVAVTRAKSHLTFVA